MNIFITGGTGFIGGHLLKMLSSKGHRIFCLVRNRQKAEIMRKGGITPIFGDIRDDNFIKQMPEGLDLVCHLAGILGKWGISNKIYEDIHIRGTENLLRACVELNIRRFIHCSSVGVLGPTGDFSFNEDAPCNPTSIYEYTKAEAEKLVLKYARNGKIDATIIRPAVVYGPGDFHMLGVFKAIKKGIFPLIEDGKALFQPTYIEDVIQGFELCLNNRRTINQIYILVGEKAVTVREFVNLAARIMGVTPPQINISRKKAGFIALLFETAGRIFRLSPPFTRAAVKFFTENKVYKIDKAIRELGYRPINLEEGLRRTIEWYRLNLYL